MKFDLPLDELERYRPPRQEPADFDEFWAATLLEHGAERTLTRQPADIQLRTVEILDLTFAGYDGQPVRAWLQLPRGVGQPVPCVIEYCGYSYGRGSAHQGLTYVADGYAHVVMDNRGQGGGGLTGSTPDGRTDLTGGRTGFLTRGLVDANTYYYRRLFVDAARLIQTVAGLPEIDPECILLRGVSQGAATALAAQAITDIPLLGTVCHLPFLCAIRRATEMVDTAPYSELTTHLSMYPEQVEKVFDVLGYFDGVNFAARCTAPAMFSVALMDTVTPPSAVYAAYNHYSGPTRMTVLPYGSHEGAPAVQERSELQFLRELLGDRHPSS
ncbi:acetylxylan esterase [Nakamurella lactea]|uniref:acetylxylan esterase n=1 Tax=Nakamurella lactea TaxID=459515 RepID=UPI00041C6087|nr:acetylxylan esterase [Nakamurella lactea]